MTMRWSVVVAALAAGTACAGGSGTAECGVAECAEVCPPSVEASGEGDGAAAVDESSPAPSGGSANLTSFEHTIVDPILEEIRSGIQPFDEEGVGICRGSGRTCDAFLGDSAQDLPPGDYMLRAHMNVPKAGEDGTWQVTLATECTTTRTSGNNTSTSTSTDSKSYEVKYGGSNGYNLSPLRTISSPNSGGAKSCDYTLTFSHPDGPREMKGSWSVPGPS